MPTKIKLLAPVIHGAATRKAGEVIEVEEAHAKSLIARKLAEHAGPKPPPSRSAEFIPPPPAEPDGPKKK